MSFFFEKKLFSLEYDDFDNRKCGHIKAYKKLNTNVILVSHPTHKF